MSRDYGCACVAHTHYNNTLEVKPNMVEVSGYDGQAWYYEGVEPDEHEAFLAWANEAFDELTNSHLYVVTGEYPYYTLNEEELERGV